MKNFDKIKERWNLSKFNEGYSFCGLIQEVRGKSCGDIDCEDCKKWLAKDYQPPILDNVEKKYLYNIIKPFRKKVRCIVKKSVYWNTMCGKEKGTAEYIEIFTSKGITSLPKFKENTMYRGMKLEQYYTLEDLDL